MLKRFMPKEGRFFDLFRQAGDLIVEAAQEFQGLLSDLPNLEARARKIKQIEHNCDEVTHHTVALLHSTFITPLDREDIHALISKMDDILDFIEAASARMALYGIKEAPPEAKLLAEICVKSAQDVRFAVNRLENLKDPQEIIKHCVEVNRLENEADHVLRDAVARLFRDEQDVRRLIKLKEIYELLEGVTDRCEDVANIVEGIVLEYA